MKQTILCLLLLVSVLLNVQGQDNTEPATDVKDVPKTEEISTEKNLFKEYYDKGDFPSAIVELEREMKVMKKQGRESAQLYYNLGNTYYRNNDLAHARLYYERALLLKPNDKDTRHNIDYLTTKIEDKILIADTFFVAMWIRAIQNMFTSDAWATIGIVSFLLLMACLGAFFFVNIINVKKSVFYVGILLVVISIASNIFAFNQKRKFEERDTAVIIAPVASVYASPDRNSKDVFTLHAGTKISITKEDRSWLEIEIDDGSIGWIERSKIEII